MPQKEAAPTIRRECIEADSTDNDCEDCSREDVCCMDGCQDAETCERRCSYKRKSQEMRSWDYKQLLDDVQDFILARTDYYPLSLDALYDRAEEDDRNRKEFDRLRRSELIPGLKFANASIEQQYWHIKSELREVWAELAKEDWPALAEELVDLQTSCETLLYILKCRHGVDPVAAKEKVQQKNRDRGYYEFPDCPGPDDQIPVTCPKCGVAGIPAVGKYDEQAKRKGRKMIITCECGWRSDEEDSGDGKA